MNTTIDHVTDFTQIAAYGVMSTPALVADGKVISFGKVLKRPKLRLSFEKSGNLAVKTKRHCVNIRSNQCVRWLG